MRAMAFQRQLQLALVLLCSVVFLRGAAQPYTLRMVRREGCSITLECLDNNHPVNDPVEYQYRPPTLTGGSLPVFVTLNGDSRMVMVQVTPQTEGEYFCRVNGMESAPRNLVAFPKPNLSTEMVAIQQGDDLRLTCDFEVGRLSSEYTIKWFRIRSGFSESLQTSDSLQVQVVQITQNDRTFNFLMIMAVGPDDESDQYYCTVDVTDPNPMGSNPFSAIGKFIKVDVYDAVHVEIEASPQVVLEGNTAQFQCVFEGDPAPSITWRLNGTEIMSGGDFGRFLIIINRVDSTARCTSTFMLRNAKAQDNGLVECEATNRNSEGTSFTAVSNATLTVLTTNVTLFLTATTLQNDPVVFLHLMLPAKFPTPVTINAVYTDTEDSDRDFTPVYRDMFDNTMEINFEIPIVPMFDTFTTQITFSSDGMVTAAIRAFEPITPSALTGQASNDEDFKRLIVMIVVPIGAVVIIITVIAIVVGVVFHRKVSRIEDDFGALDFGGPPVPPVPDLEVKIPVPWQALFSVKDGPWQACWHLYTQTVVYKEIEIEGEIALDIPWQATDPLDVPIWQDWEHIKFMYQYQVETYDAVVRRQPKPELHRQQAVAEQQNLMEKASALNHQEIHQCPKLKGEAILMEDMQGSQ